MVTGPDGRSALSRVAVKVTDVLTAGVGLVTRGWSPSSLRGCYDFLSAV